MILEIIELVNDTLKYSNNFESQYKLILEKYLDLLIKN